MLITYDSCNLMYDFKVNSLLEETIGNMMKHVLHCNVRCNVTISWSWSCHGAPSKATVTWAPLMTCKTGGVPCAAQRLRLWCQPPGPASSQSAWPGCCQGISGEHRSLVMGDPFGAGKYQRTNQKGRLKHEILGWICCVDF